MQIKYIRFSIIVHFYYTSRYFHEQIKPSTTKKITTCTKIKTNYNKNKLSLSLELYMKDNSQQGHKYTRKY